MNRLYVKSFGPLKEIDIELNHINLFIGENGSGKSVLGKLITIFLNFNGFLQGEDIFKKLKAFQIDFLDESSIIKLYKEDQKDEPLVEVKNKMIHFSPEFGEKDKLKEYLLLREAIKRPHELGSLFSTFEEEDKKNSIKLIKEIVKKMLSGDEEFIKKWLRHKEEANSALERVKSQYIPAERNLISLFNQSLSSFILAEIPLPEFLLRFSSEYQKAGKQITELALLNVTYRNDGGEERIYYSDQASLPLVHSSSGIQSALPLYLTTKYFGEKHHAIIIEEPELNLFPKAQCQTIHYLVEQMNAENKLFLMTHSPYVLSSLNILLYAYKVGSLNEKAKAKVSALVPESRWINPNDFSAYYLENGTVRSLKGSTGLIGENEIDESSDEIEGQFEELLEIYREHKHDK